MGSADVMLATKAPRTVGTKKAKKAGRNGLNTGMDAAATPPTMRNTRCLTSERPASAKPIDGHPQPIPSAKLNVRRRTNDNVACPDRSSTRIQRTETLQGGRQNDCCDGCGANADGDAAKQRVEVY